ncbi:MAG: DUF1800 family protein [Nocardioidaceae bacterium]
MLRRYLNYLAHHPATAQRIARKLAVRFVSDDPSSGLVAHLAQVFSRSGTDIKETLRALVRHPEFKASAGKKVRTPSEDLVATLRAYDVDITRPQRESDAANAIYYLSKNMGQAPFGWERPDGFPDNGSAWSSAGPDDGFVPRPLRARGRVLPEYRCELPVEGVLASAAANPVRRVRRPPVPNAAGPPLHATAPRSGVHRHGHEAR